MRVHLIRHPRPAGATGVCYGRTDLAVSNEDLEAAAARVRTSLSAPVDRCFTSPLLRCVGLARRLRGDVVVDDRLLEIDFGAWEGCRWDDLDRAAFDEWAADYVHRRVPGGESWDDVRTRATSFLDDLRGAGLDSVAVVTHAGVIRAVLALVLGIDLGPTWRVRVPFGAVVTVDLGPDNGAGALVGLTM